MQTWLQAKEALRMWKRARKFRGFDKFPGAPWQICAEIMEACWKGSYFTTSTGHFRQFYSRDFGICTEALLKLNHREKVISTLRYALDRFKGAHRITTQISPEGRVLDFPSYTPESLAYILRSVVLTKDKDLLAENRHFFEMEVQKAFKVSIDPDTGLVMNRNFSTMKDNARRNSPIYINCMTAMTSNILNRLKWENPFREYNYKKILKDYYWNGSYFLDDLSGKDYIAGDANTFPFWTDVFNEKAMFDKSIEAIQSENLDKPFPLKYTAKPVKGQYLFFPSLFAPNYEGNTVWLHLGACFIETVHKFNPELADEYLEGVGKLVARYRTFPEVLNPNGSIYRTPFYVCDEGMLWASIPLSLRGSK